MRHLAPQAPAVDLAFAKPYLDVGLPARACDAKPVPGLPNAGELILALKSAPAAIDFSSGSDRAGGFVAPNLSVRASPGRWAPSGRAAPAHRRSTPGRSTRQRSWPGRCPSCSGCSASWTCWRRRVFEEAPAFVSDALDAVGKLLGEAERLKQRSTRPRPAGRRGRRRGARRSAAVAQQAKDELDARVGTARAHADALVAAVQGLPANPESVSAAAVDLAGDLQPLLDAIGVPGVPAALRSALRQAGARP